MSFIQKDSLKKTSLNFGQQSLNTIQAPRPQSKSFLPTLFFGAKSLLKGLKLTFSYFIRPSTVVTQQYPENRKTLKMFDRFRAQLVLKYDEKGLMNCTGCKICDKACPNGSIHVIAKKGDLKKVELDRYIWRFDTCTFCNLCVYSCPFDAIEMTSNFENSVFDRRLLHSQINSYSGPYKKLIEQQEDPKICDQMMTPRIPFEGDVPLAQQTQGVPK